MLRDLPQMLRVTLHEIHRYELIRLPQIRKA